MDGSEQDKSERPTAFKLMRSREKGVVARGMDLGFFAGLAAFAAYAWISGPAFGAAMADALAGALVTAPNLAGGANEIVAVTALIFSQAARPLMFMAGTIFLVVLLAELAQTGVIFTANPLKPDFSRLNPAKGLKRIFSVRMLIETLKNVLKMGIYVAIAFAIISAALSGRTPGITDSSHLAQAMAGSGLRMIAGFIAVAFLFAILDQIIVRRDFLKQMRMSRREVKREMRDREGEPRIKQRRKQLHGQFTKLSESLRNVRGADVVITNPTRLAIALRYDPATMSAPRVVAKGAHEFAARIRGLAFIHGVVIVEDKVLARALFRQCDAGREISEKHYRRVADIYRTIRPRPLTDGGAAAHA